MSFRRKIEIYVRLAQIQLEIGVLKAKRWWLKRKRRYYNWRAERAEQQATVAESRKFMKENDE
jgi:hypothetical protein